MWITYFRLISFVWSICRLCAWIIYLQNSKKKKCWCFCNVEGNAANKGCYDIRFQEQKLPQNIHVWFPNRFLKNNSQPSNQSEQRNTMKSSVSGWSMNMFVSECVSSLLLNLVKRHEWWNQMQYILYNFNSTVGQQ